MSLGIDKENLGFVKYYAVILGILGITFYLGYVTASWYQDRIIKERDVLQLSTNNLAEENRGLQSKFNAMKIELDVATLTNDELRNTIQAGIARESKLKEQVGFYQRVMAPELTQDGFVVERIEISPTASESTYLVSMVMLQHEDIKAVIKGDLSIKVIGRLDTNAEVIDFVQLQDEPKTPLNFAFKYFQVINTSITLPESFVPHSIEINTDVYKFKRKRGSYQKSILWRDALNTD